jgi:hypothetical protein
MYINDYTMANEVYSGGSFDYYNLVRIDEQLFAINKMIGWGYKLYGDIIFIEGRGYFQAVVRK